MMDGGGAEETMEKRAQKRSEKDWIITVRETVKMDKRRQKKKKEESRNF